MSAEFRAFGLSRHRIGRDGDGVTTLVAGVGCPLECKYCLNPHCKTAKARLFTLEELYDAVKLDSLYFEATGGGVTFGGGEPLLQSEFIAEFVEFVRKKGHSWRFFVETSLAVEDDISPLLPLIDGWIVDVKDLNREIYLAYTGRTSELTMANLELLREVAERVTVRLPLIPNFNSDADHDASEVTLRELGFRNFDRFDYIIRQK